MQGTALLGFWDRLYGLRRSRTMQTGARLGLVVLGPVLAFVTFLYLGPFRTGTSPNALRLVLLADLVYVLLVATLVLATVLRVVAARRAQSSGSRLHLRLSALFAAVALGPTILVAIFAVLTINVGLEGWFSDRVRNVVGASRAAAEAYEFEQRRDLITDAQTLAARIGLAYQAGLVGDDGGLRQLLTNEQAQIQRGLREAFVIDGTGEIRARGELSYLFDFEQPDAEDLARAAAGETVVIRDWANNEFRALLSLPGYIDRMLYVSRNVDGALLQLLDETQESVRLYTQLEADRGTQLFQFGLLYLGFALILILAAVWMGLWIAERLARPVGELAGAVARVGNGDFDVRVTPADTGDEIATLGQSFNRMTRQLKGQHNALVAGHRETEVQRRLFDSVLSSVTAGVIGLEAEGHIVFLNRSARRLLDLTADGETGQPLALVVPEFSALFDRARDTGQAVQEEIRLTRKGRMESLLVRIAPRAAEDGAREGFVVAFDDVTELVSAQRMAAWGDVARRIAHEIKNPLTPIQLSAERIRRRFGPRLIEEDAEALENLVDVIVRQTGDLRRIVDEFSKFARMPQPETRDEDFARLIRDAVLLQESGQPGVRFVSNLPDGPMVLPLDSTMIGQALTNLLKNAGEAIESFCEKGAPSTHSPEIRVELMSDGTSAILRISDNGSGLPEDRTRLFEPYVTTREKGTGLGLPIVRKIIEEHGGTLALLDAPVFGGTDRPGAMAEIRLPLAAPQPGRRARKGQ
ncbi:PAS domain-containing sensor histidine kinase [Gemmobacter megaterium]|nr:PAS domain-containing sensor histidine kinase [Gemmobacter megaterium]